MAGQISIVEKLADLEHKRWSHWMKYLFSLCEMQEDGSAIIPLESVKHWKRQIDTSYADLSEKAKESDRKEARRTIELVTNYVDNIVSRTQGE